jgi:hypothetical protein
MAGLLKLISDASDMARGAGRGQRISTRFPTAKAATENPLTENLIINEQAMQVSPQAYDTNTGIMGNYNTVLTNAKSSKGKGQAAMDSATDNLLWLYNQVPKETRDVTRNWYVGANKMANELATKHNVSVDTASAVIAALSPQKDWYQNLSLAERVLDIYGKSSGKKMSKEAAAKAKELYIKPNHLADLKIASTKPFEELTPNQKAIYIRSTDQAHNDRSYDITNPLGQRTGKALTGKGELATAAWGSNVEIGKAIKAIDDPSIENISRQMGEAHKVRNFYNNIADPFHAEFDPMMGDVTIDTHAVAADQMKPLSGNSAQVAQNFGSGGGSASTSLSGAGGTYGLHADATRRAAQAMGIMPREMQSITWEAARSMFPKSFKTTDNVQQIEAVWDLFKQKKMSLEDARGLISEKAGGLAAPDWATGRPVNGIYAGAGSASVGGGVSGIGLSSPEQANAFSADQRRALMSSDIPAEWLGLPPRNVSQPDLSDPEANAFQGNQGAGVSPIQAFKGMADTGAGLLRGAVTEAMGVPNSLVGLGGGIGGMMSSGSGGLLERFGQGAERAQNAVKGVPILGQSAEDWSGLLPRLTSMSGMSEDELKKLQQFGSNFSPF